MGGSVTSQIWLLKKTNSLSWFTTFIIILSKQYLFQTILVSTSASFLKDRRQKSWVNCRDSRWMFSATVPRTWSTTCVGIVLGISIVLYIHHNHIYGWTISTAMIYIYIHDSGWWYDRYSNIGAYVMYVILFSVV